MHMYVILFALFNLCNLCNGVCVSCCRIPMNPCDINKLFKDNIDWIFSYFDKYIEFNDENDNINIDESNNVKYISGLYKFKINDDILLSCIIVLEQKELTCKRCSDCFKIEFNKGNLFPTYCGDINGNVVYDKYVKFNKLKLCYSSQTDKEKIKFNGTLYLNISDDCLNETHEYTRVAPTVILLEKNILCAIIGIAIKNIEFVICIVYGILVGSLVYRVGLMYIHI